MDDIKYRARRCPKCRKYPHTVTEVIENTTSFEVLEHGILDHEEGIHEMGEYVRVFSECSCGHIWVNRGINQIWDLEVW